LVAKTAGGGGNIAVVARVKAGVTPAQLAAQMSVVTQDFRSQYARDSSGQFVLSFLPYQRMLGADVRPFLLAVVWRDRFRAAIACANVANLLLARGGCSRP